MADIFREGWTERIRYALTHDGAVLDLTGLTIALTGANNTGESISLTGAVGSDNPTGGIAYFDPGPADLLSVHSPYQVRWKITDGAGKIAYFPRTEPIVWDVRKP